MCNLCYQYENATLVSKAIEFYTDIAIAYSKTSKYVFGNATLVSKAIELYTDIAIAYSKTNKSSLVMLPLWLKP